VRLTISTPSPPRRSSTVVKVDSTGLHGTSHDAAQRRRRLASPLVHEVLDDAQCLLGFRRELRCYSGRCRAMMAGWRVVGRRDEVDAEASRRSPNSSHFAARKSLSRRLPSFLPAPRPTAEVLCPGFAGGSVQRADLVKSEDSTTAAGTRASAVCALQTFATFWPKTATYMHRACQRGLPLW